MAPERFFGQPAGIATDVYELAVTLYMMLAGRLPWDDVADPETRLAPRSLVELAPVPDALDVEIRRALSTRVQNRPASATALLQAVTAAASDATGDEPEAGETARLRSGAQNAIAFAPTDASVQQRASTTSGPTKPERPSPLSAEHQTPLAWAPTVPSAVTTKPARKRRWPYVAAFVGVAGVAAAFALLRVRDRPRHAIARPTPSDNDPWADHGSASATTPATSATSESADAGVPASAFALVDNKLEPSKYRAEAAAAIARLPADTHLVAAIHLTDVRANDQTKKLLESFAKQPKFRLLTAMIPACVRSLVGDAEWIVLGSPSLDHSQASTLIVRGRWQRSDAAKCFGDDTPSHEAIDGATLFRVGDKGWLDFLDDHTAYITLETKLGGEAFHKLAHSDKPAAGMTAHTKELLARLPTDRSLAFVADGDAKDDWDAIGLPKGTDVFAWMRIESDGAAMDLAADPHDEEAAQAAVDRNKADIDGVFATASDAVGKLEAVRDKTVVHIRGRVTSVMLGLVTQGLDP
jgi:hypothetical protein